MKQYSLVEAQGKLSTVLDVATKQGEVKIVRSNKRTYTLKPENKERSPLDVKGIKTDITMKEILDAIHESRGSSFARGSKR